MKKDLLVYMLAELLIKGMPFFLIPYLTHMLGIIGFAELSLYRSYFAIILVFVGLNAGSAISRYRYYYGKRNIDNLVVTSFITIAAIGFIFLIVSYFIGNMLLIMAVIASILQGCLAALLSKYQSDKRVLAFTGAQLCNVFISTGLTFIGFYCFEPNVFIRVYSVLIGISLVLLIGIITLKYKLSKRLFTKNIKYIVFFTIPLIISNLSLVAKGNVDRLLIDYVYDTQTLGLMSVGMQIGSIVTVVYLVINRTVTPYVFQYFKENEVDKVPIKKDQWIILTLISFFPSLFSSLIDERYYLMLLGEGFIGAKYYVVSYLFVLSFQFYIIILSWGFIYQNKIKYITYATISGAVFHLFFINIFINFDATFIPFATLFGTFLNIYLLFFYRNKLVNNHK